MKTLFRCIAIVASGTAIVAGLQFAIYKMYERKESRFVTAGDLR